MKTTNVKYGFFIFLSAIFALVTNRSNGQIFELGIRVMPTFSALSLNTSAGGTIKGEATLGYGLGGFLAFNFTEHAGIQVECIYNTLSQNYVENNFDKTLKLKYINIPILFSLNTNKLLPVNLNFVAGPQVGFSVGSSLSSSGSGDTTAFQSVVAVNKNDLGFAYGAGLDFGLNPAETIRFGVGFRGVMGLVDISDHSQSITTDSYYLLDRTRIKTYSGYIGFSAMF